MAITDLTGTTWLMNSTTATPSSTIWKSINFTSNSMSFNAITIYDDMDNEQVIAYRGAEEFPTIVYSWGWTNEAYRTIVITGGTDVTDASLIAWLEANATEQTPASPDVVISYNGNEIATMSDSGTKTLQTSGKYVPADILIQYTKSGSSTQVNADWTATTGVSSILHKPSTTSVPNVTSAGSAATFSYSNGALVITSGSAPTLGTAISVYSGS